MHGLRQGWQWWLLPLSAAEHMLGSTATCEVTARRQHWLLHMHCVRQNSQRE